MVVDDDDLFDFKKKKKSWMGLITKFSSQISF
jgi:hypothetical protein